MTKILKSDFFRIGKSKLLYGLLAFTFALAFGLVLMIFQDVRLGISVFGNLTMFKTAGDIFQLGIKYHKGLGILVAILISVFIGQEYQWNTWQQKWITGNSRTRIYLSKVVVSAIVSVSIFLVFEITTLLFSGVLNVERAGNAVLMLIGGSFMYAALGAVICMLSMLIRNSTASVIICLSYILFCETLSTVAQNIGRLSDAAAKVVDWLMGHSIYGMSLIMSDASVSAGVVLSVSATSLAIMAFSTLIGLCVFRKYEL